MTTLPNGGPAQAPKQIRFVNNQGQPPSKRPRIEAACLTCRRRKTRCSGDRPLCNTCVKNGHECLGYSDVPEKRPVGKKRDQAGRPISSKAARDDSIEQNEPEDDYSDEELADSGHSWRGPKPKGWKEHRESSSNTPASASRRSGDRSNDWNHDVDGNFQSRNASYSSRRSTLRPNSSYSEDGHSPSTRSPLQHQHRHESRRVPFFRYFGTTAIVPGYKQITVNIRDRRRSRGGSFSTTSPGSVMGHSSGSHYTPYIPIPESLDDLPVYDSNDPGPTPLLIISLVKTFFRSLGCNYPFLREERCLRHVREKKLEPILVDAMCALAARFCSDLPVFQNERDGPTNRSEYGHIFAQRARNATVDTFPCPSLAAVQACLLMAYEGFGVNEDSALWMYLGIAIRMAVDIGLGKHVGIKYEGGSDPWYMRGWARKDSEGADEGDRSDSGDEEQSRDDLEQERIDTFWALFILDRIISSGTGRPVTFRDDDFELDLPEPSFDPKSGRPDPFPMFIRIIHLYGRVSDIFNNVKRTEDLTPEKLAKLAELESELTKIYQSLDDRLQFNVVNFQDAVKAGQGTGFILLHFWFHALIIILHQPTLLPFGNMNWAPLLPNSRELSMSSAKTIADILVFAQFIDATCIIGTPFASQPIYIAACSFLTESFSNVPGSPPVQKTPDAQIKTEAPNRPLGKTPSAGDSMTTKHSLLASAASNNYQTCYKSLQQLHDFWEGVDYILSALDLKAKRVAEVEALSAKGAKGITRESLSRFPNEVIDKVAEAPPSPGVPVVGLALTGTTNSPNTAVSVIRLNTHPIHGALKDPAPPPPPPPFSTTTIVSAATPPGNMVYDPIRQTDSPFQPAFPQPNVSAVRSPIHPSKRQQLPTRSSTASSYTEGRAFSRFDGTQTPEETNPNRPASHSKLHVLAGVTAQQAAHAFNVSQSFTSSPQLSSMYDSSMVQGQSSGYGFQESLYHGLSHPQDQQSHHFQHQQYRQHQDDSRSSLDDNNNTGDDNPESSRSPDNGVGFYQQYWPGVTTTGQYSLPGPMSNMDLITENYERDLNLGNVMLEARDLFFELDMFLPSESLGGASTWENEFGH